MTSDRGEAPNDDYWRRPSEPSEASPRPEHAASPTEGQSAPVPHPSASTPAVSAEEAALWRRPADASGVDARGGHAGAEHREQRPWPDAPGAGAGGAGTSAGGEGTSAGGAGVGGTVASGPGDGDRGPNPWRRPDGPAGSATARPGRSERSATGAKTPAPPYVGPPRTQPPPPGWRPPTVVQPPAPRSLPPQDLPGLDASERGARTLTLGVGMVAGAITVVAVCLICSRIVF